MTMIYHYLVVPFIAIITMIKSESASGGQRRVGSILAGVLSVIEQEKSLNTCAQALEVYVKVSRRVVQTRKIEVKQ